ncbi:NAD(P)H-dependent oxidoreductase [Kordiimonas sp. SCSIO 12603]|uniref:NADPH-dependent FMN reductase n=1 Tax=Kordiimonas sp. SCSIO 12603 TaxID=2829596 RepID=UPI00210419DB|nr:NAD(P)H-dependent oxidoreductase [Kordiimonas sp. SCSIO 12603]UTW57139.1 NAD(P)H-dependent oxidoreductase [Kordiimonas sp. SCSIO 12603]
MNILAFAATNSSQSINKQLVTYAAEVLATAQSDITTEILDINDYELPLFSIDRENQLGKPELAQAFFDKIGAADAVIISFAEHNGSYTAAYKNLFDWASRIDPKVFQGKPMVLLATSPGAGGARNVLAVAETSAPHFAGDVKASLSIPSFYDNFDMETGALSNEALAVKLKDALVSLL